MSLRWIQSNREAPTCDEESSDIDDSDGSDDSCDTDLSLDNFEEIDSDRLIVGNNNGKSNGCHRRDSNRSNVPCVLWDPRKPMQNPVYRSALIKLYSRTGYHLIISESGRVLTTTSANNRQGCWFIVSPVSFGVVRIQTPDTGRYLAFNKKGHLYGEMKETKDNTEWEQWSIGNYEAFRSRKYHGQSWWIGIKKNGRTKSGPSTGWGQKAIQFVAIGCD